MATAAGRTSAPLAEALLRAQETGQLVVPIVRDRMCCDVERRAVSKDVSGGDLHCEGGEVCVLWWAAARTVGTHRVARHMASRIAIV